MVFLLDLLHNSKGSLWKLMSLIIEMRHGVLSIFIHLC